MILPVMSMFTCIELTNYIAISQMRASVKVAPVLRHSLEFEPKESKLEEKWLLSWS